MKSSIPMSFGEKHQHDFSFSSIISESGYFCPEHWHDCFEVIFVREGSLTLVSGKDSIALGRGDIAVLPPYTLHSTDGRDNFLRMDVFGYTENLISSPEISVFNMKYLSIFRHRGEGGYRVLRSGNEKTEEVVYLLDSAMREYETEHFCREILVRAKILELHAALSEIYLDEKSERETISPYLTDTEAYIEAHIGEDISPYEIAAALHVSYSHLSRTISEDTGYPIGELILRMKMNYAERIMTRDKNVSITEIALSVGFNSASYFTRIYRRFRGVTPSAFRKMLRMNEGLEA